MNTNERRQDARPPVKTEGLKPQQSAGGPNEIGILPTTREDHAQYRGF